MCSSVSQHCQRSLSPLFSSEDVKSKNSLQTLSLLKSLSNFLKQLATVQLVIFSKHYLNRRKQCICGVYFQQPLKHTFGLLAITTCLSVQYLQNLNSYCMIMHFMIYVQYQCQCTSSVLRRKSKGVEVRADGGVACSHVQLSLRTPEFVFHHRHVIKITNVPN